VGVLILLGVGPAPGRAPPGPSPPRRYQNTPLFPLTLDQVDADVKDVTLEVYDRSARRWRTCGDFCLRREGDKAVQGGITFRARDEREYLLRSVARDRAGNVQETGAGPECAQVVAVYDRTPPQVDVVSPGPGAAFPAGEEIRVAWRTRDANPVKEKCVSAEVSRDGGRTWAALASGLDDVGGLALPGNLPPGPATLRVTVWDLCGNRGEGISHAFSVTAAGPAVVRAPKGPDQTAATPTPAEEPGRVTPAPKEEPRRVATAPKEEPRPAAPVPKEEPRRATTDPQTRARAEERYRLGAAALVSGRHAEAVPRLREAITLDPDLESAWLDLSVALTGVGELAAAERTLAGAEKRFARSARFPFNRGLVLVRLGKPGDARVSFARACQLDPDLAEAHWSLATLAVEAGDLDSACAQWREVVRCTPPDSSLHQRAATYLEASSR